MCEQEPEKETLYSEEQAKGDYNARLGYGTDQGRWLVKELGDKESQAARRPSRQPSRVFHDIDEAPVETVSGKGESKEKPDAMTRFMQGPGPFVAMAAGVVILVGLILWLVTPHEDHRG